MENLDKLAGTANEVVEQIIEQVPVIVEEMANYHIWLCVILFFVAVVVPYVVWWVATGTIVPKVSNNEKGSKENIGLCRLIFLVLSLCWIIPYVVETVPDAIRAWVAPNYFAIQKLSELFK